MGGRTVNKKVLRREARARRILRIVPEENNDRPTTRAECKDGPRPCPYVSCRYHLYLDVNSFGNLKLNFPDRELDELEHTCALDVADGGPHNHRQIAALLEMSHQRIWQIEKAALGKAVDLVDPDWRNE